MAVTFPMDIALEIREKLGETWMANIYREKIRTLRTRAYTLGIPEKENAAEIQHTLLGVEVKVANVRLACPDLSTARYLQVFARLGCQEIAIPYDITKISTLADELESSWHQILLHFEEVTNGKNPSAIGRLRSSLVKDIRNQLDEIGAGEKMPQFNQNTKQRAN